MYQLKKNLFYKGAQWTAGEGEAGWWCAVLRRCGVSLVRQLEPLERVMLSPEDSLPDIMG